MSTLAGCQLSTDLLDAWSELLVIDPAPFFLPDALVVRLPRELSFHTRSEFNLMNVSLGCRNSYMTYAVHADGTWVVWLSPDEFDDLSPMLQTDLLYAQWQFERGQVYDFDAVRPMLDACGATDMAMSRVVETPVGMKLVLDTAVWAMLSVRVQREWLTAFVTKQQAPYTVIAPDDVPWDDVAPHLKTHTQTFVNSFLPWSGPNCFALTLSAITPQAHTATTLRQLWLHQPPFFRGLEARGYGERTDLLDPLADLRDAVVVWFDAEGMAQHACYLIGNGIALNKNSHAWYTPQHLVALPDLLDFWKDDPFEVRIYQRLQAAIEAG